VDSFHPSARVDDPPPAPGAQRDFWTWDFAVMPPAPKRIHATLRSLGEHAAIWVDDAAWGKGVQAADIATLEKRFNRAAPSGAVDPTRGVFDIDCAYFGGLPHGIDPDPRVTILLTPFAQFNGTSLDGYFNAFDQMPDSETWSQYQQHSNEKNIIYLNTAGPSVSGDYMQGVLAHEFSHLLQFGRNPEQASWLGETMAETAMALNGYHTDFGHVARHQKRPDRPVESDTYVDYGASYLLGTYMLERYGAGFISEVAANPGSGREAIEKSLRGDTFASLIADWSVANYADARGGIAPGHHYASLDVPAPAESIVGAGQDRVEGDLKPTGAAYVRIDVPGGARVEADGEAAVRVMRFDGPRLHVDEIAANSDTVVPQGAVVAISSVGTSPLHYSVAPA
jgi:hypothetical protein